MSKDTDITPEEYSKLKIRFYKETMGIYTWEQCAGLVGPGKIWLDKNWLTLKRAMELIDSKEYYPSPF